MIHNQPGEHWELNHGMLTLNLQSVIDDFRWAVDTLGELLRSTDEMRELAAAELAGRTIRLIPITVVAPVSVPEASASNA